MRVFTAIDIQDREILLKLEEMQEELDYGFNNVESGKMHITLQFFQDVADDEVNEIIEAMKDVDKNPFSLKIKGAGVFPSKDYIRVVWAGIESEDIHEFKQQVSEHPVSSDNNYDFHPHVTLARVDKISRKDKKEFRKKLEEYEEERIGEIEVNCIKLFESVQTENGNEYRLLEKVEL